MLRLYGRSSVLPLTPGDLLTGSFPGRHKLIADESAGAQLVCASMEFDGGASNPLSASLPDLLVLSLDELPLLADTLRWLFGEAAAGHCGSPCICSGHKPCIHCP